MQSERIEELKTRLLEEAEMVQNMLNIALVTQDPESGFRRVSALEDRVNALEKEIDELAIRLIALYQPEAGDLRRILMMYRINIDLERLGDQAFNIAQSARKIPSYQMQEQQINSMQEATVQMLRTALKAFMDEDALAAESVCLNDRIVDDLNREIYHLVRASIMQEPANTGSYLHLLRIAKNLERCADLATNIAENTIYLVRGEDVRHTGI